jgi:hypothetical protein
MMRLKMGLDNRTVSDHGCSFRIKIMNCLILLFFLFQSGLGQNIPSFMANDRYNSMSRSPWIREFSDQVILKDTEVPADDYMICKEFSFRAADEVTTWGRGKEIPGIYFDEHLPGFFKRRLDFDEFNAEQGRLDWIFTGTDGGFTVSITKDSLWLFQRFYDSFAFNSIQDKTLYSKRHPEKIWMTSAMAWQGKLRTLELTVTHKLELILHVNETMTAHQQLVNDVTAHQLRWTGNNPSVTGKMLGQKTRNCEITVNRDVKYQKMLGFGGIAIPTAYQGLSEEGKEQWWKIVKEYNLLLHREYPIGQKLNPEMDNWDHIGDATVHYYGDNFPNSEISDFDYIKKVQDMGGLNIFEFWKLPSWVQSSKTVDTEAYVRAMLSYCKTAKEKTGRAPAIVGVQNEITQPAETWTAMTLALRKALDETGFREVKIHMHNSSFLRGGVRAAEAFTGNPEVWSDIDYSASNMYDYQNYFTNPDGFDSTLIRFHELTADKPFISTELSVNRPCYQVDSYRIAFQMGQLYYKNLTLCDAVALMYCWTILNTVQPSYSMSRSLFGVDELNGFIPGSFGFHDRVFGGFSRRVREGMERVDVRSGDSDLLAVAFTGQHDRMRTLILMNRDTAPVNVQMADGYKYKWMETASQYYRNKVSDQVPSALIIQPGEIITLTNVPLQD